MMPKDALPIRGIQGNLIFTPRDVWACYHIRTRSYRAEPSQRKAGLAREFMGYARMAEADIQILRVSRRFDADSYVRKLQEATSDGMHQELWDEYLDQQYDLLDKLEAWTPEVFVCVRLAEPVQDFQGRAARLFERTPKETLKVLKAHTQERVPFLTHDLTDRARTAEARIRTALDARAARYDEIQWLIRRAFCRGVLEPVDAPEEVGGIPHEESERTLRRWFLEHGIEHHYRYLKSMGEHGESYQAGLCLGEMGHAEPFTRQVELMFTALEEHPWPIDAALNIRFIPNDQALRRIQHQVARTRHQLEDEENSAHGARGEGRRRVDLSEEFHDRLSSTGEPLLDGTLSFMVAAGSQKELERRMRALREGFPWPLYRPYGDQLELWKQHLPAQPSRVKGYERPFTIQQIGAMVPHATHEAGSNTESSLYIGRTLEGRWPILFDLREASGTDRPPTITLEASLGGGKTMLLQLLYYQAFLQGFRIVDIDPKGDHRFHLLPEVAPHTQTIVLGPNPEHRGKLDPLRIAPDNERQDSAVTFLISVLPNVTGKEEAMIHGAVGRVLDAHGPKSCCMMVIEELEKGTQVEKDAGEMLRQYCGHGIVQLGFARPSDPLPGGASEQVTYLNVRALRSPGHLQTLRSEMTPAERHGAAVVQLISLYAMKIMETERNRPKVAGFDEAYMLSTHAIGEQMMNQWLRWARSEYGIPILGTQNIPDLAKFKNLIGISFLGAMQSREDAEVALAARDLDAQGSLCNALCERYGQSENTKGQFLLNDLRGRCEEVQIDPGIRLLRDLHTTPVEKQEAPSLVDMVKAFS